MKVRYDGRTGFALKSNGELWAWGYGYYNEFMNDHYDGIFANSSRTGFDIKNDWAKQVPFLYTVGVVDFDYYLGQLMIRNIGDSFYIAGRSFSNANRYDTYTDQAVRDTYYSVMDSYPTYYDFLAAVYNRNYGYNSYNAGFFRDSSSGGSLSERVIIPGMDNRGIMNDYSVFKGSYVINDVGTLLDYVNEGFAPQVVAKDVSWVSRSSIDKFNAAFDETGFRRSGNTYYIKENGDVYQINNETNSHRLIIDSKSTTTKLTDSRDLLFLFASNWALEELLIAKNYGLTKPIESEEFVDYITREQFCEIAVILYKELTGKALAESKLTPFSDTSNSSVIKAFELGIVNGVGGGKFAPKDQITREQLAVMLNNVFSKAGLTERQAISVKFTDEKSFASWSKDAVLRLARQGVIKGVSSDTFAPKNNVTIEQAVLLAKRLLQL